MNLLFSSVWQKKVLQMNRSAKVIITTKVILVWQIADDSPNFLPSELSHYTVVSMIVLLEYIDFAIL